MNRPRIVVALCLACALFVSLLAAQGASAATTAFTCSKSVTTKTWSDAHCTNSSTGTKEYGHVAIPAGERTFIAGSKGTFNEGKATLKATVSGVVLELEAKFGGPTVEGSMENTEVGGEMVAKGEGFFTFSSVIVKKPTEKGCKVYTDTSGTKGEEGVVHSEPLKGQTTNGMGVKIEGKEGVLAKFLIEGCAKPLEALNQTYSVNGSVVGEPNGGEIQFTHANTTAAGTLNLNGSINAGFEGSATIRELGMGGSESNALTVTTPPYLTD